MKSELNYKKFSLGVKRVIDVITSMCAIFLLWPLFLIIAFLVKISGPGPIFYRGLRSGLNNKPFNILKFRTMVDNAEKIGGSTTGTNDPRVTRIGFFLRKTKLDELPQFINVLKGEMSIVGPRPEVLEYTAKYKGEETCIFLMRPGITDYASIEFANLDDIVGNIDPDKFFRENILPRKTELRIKYVKEWSFKNDFYIILQTMLRVFKRIFFH